MNVCEYSEYVNHKDRGIKYPEYREDERESTIKSINVWMFLPDEQSFEEGGGNDVVTPRSSLLRESVRVDGGVLWSSKQFQTLGELRNSREE